MIAHVSLPAENCEHVAHVLAAMLQGVALRFPPGGPNAWNCWSRTEQFQIVVTPCGHFMRNGTTEAEFETRPARLDERAYETHFAMAVEQSAAEVIQIAHAAGWPARVCNRGGFFDVVEVWVEGAYLVEILDPSQLADYSRTMSAAGWERAFGVSRSG